MLASTHNIRGTPVSEPGLSIDFSNLSPATAEAVRSFAAFIQERREDQDPEAFADFEIGKQAFAVCRAAFGDYARDERSGPIRRDGQVFYRNKQTSRTIHALSVRFSRWLYRVPSGSSSISPVDETLGLDYLTNPASYRALLVLDHCTPRDGAELKLEGMNPSSSHLGRLTAGDSWKEKEEAADTRGAEAAEEAVSCAVSLDGVALRSDGEARWREASSVTVSFHDADGNRLNTLY